MKIAVAYIDVYIRGFSGSQEIDSCGNSTRHGGHTILAADLVKGEYYVDRCHYKLEDLGTWIASPVIKGSVRKILRPRILKPEPKYTLA